MRIPLMIYRNQNGKATLWPLKQIEPTKHIPDQTSSCIEKNKSSIFLWSRNRQPPEKPSFLSLEKYLSLGNVPYLFVERRNTSDSSNHWGSTATSSHSDGLILFLVETVQTPQFIRSHNIPKAVSARILDAFKNNPPSCARVQTTNAIAVRRAFSFHNEAAPRITSASKTGIPGNRMSSQGCFPFLL
ncbi:uncharacterized protein [Physcomitrium patens]|uniref:uncharacterized protein n=1 Tax=Physcomitrium patens TaxID=3218 RepID=UPI000D15D8D9|nr:uncharacterized protein LOC112293689 [Physcomitrium patens]|eukprot:XP_024399164.1 uncharacterized protein LOC112293689 [Physcomitrella patens]